MISIARLYLNGNCLLLWIFANLVHTVNSLIRFLKGVLEGCLIKWLWPMGALKGVLEGSLIKWLGQGEIHIHSSFQRLYVAKSLFFPTVQLYCTAPLHNTLCFLYDVRLCCGYEGWIHLRIKGSTFIKGIFYDTFWGIFWKYLTKKGYVLKEWILKSVFNSLH